MYVEMVSCDSSSALSSTSIVAYLLVSSLSYFLLLLFITDIPGLKPLFFLYKALPYHLVPLAFLFHTEVQFFFPSHFVHRLMYYP
jgi:hypothetical protein